jgi:hypothetical protein
MLAATLIGAVERVEPFYDRRWPFYFLPAVLTLDHRVFDALLFAPTIPRTV